MDVADAQMTIDPSETAADLRDELHALVTDLRTAVAWHQRAGAWAAPTATATATASRAVEAAVEAVPDVLDAAEDAPARRSLPIVPGASLAQIREDLGDCTRCKLHATRKNIVFGVGSPTAALMFIGEAPGADEDRLGDPFVGKAGQLLDKMIEAMGWGRDTVYIANVLKCRPPGNRDPQPDEIDACNSFLARQIRAVAPRVIVTLGRPASHLILRTDAPMSALRGRFQQYQDGIKVMPTFHPAYLLRSPEHKRDTWSDLKQVIGELDRLGIQSPAPPRG